MFSEQEHDELYRLACAWAKQQEAAIVALGSGLSQRQLALASGAGLQQPARVRILAVPYIPIPDDEKLRAATVQTNMITRACRGIAIGYGVMLRADCWSD